MSSPQKGLNPHANDAVDAASIDESSFEYETLPRRLQEIETRFKLGDVDEQKINPQTGKAVWTFEAELDELEQLVLKYQDRLLAECASSYFKFVSIRAEAKDYYGTATPAQRLDLFQLALQLYRQLPKRVAGDVDGVDSEERKTLKNMVRVIVAGLEYLHTTSEFGSAITYAQGLYDFINNSGLATKTNPAYGTKSVVCYFLGRTHRQRGIDDDYRQAIDYFYQCSEYYSEMARRRGNLTEDVIYARTRAMVSLAFGAGFLFFNAQSDLARGKGIIAQARLAFLKDDGDICCKLHYNYLELLYASILREEAGELLPAREGVEAAAEQAATHDKLDRALEILNRCQETLAKKPNYYIHLLYNKALLYLYRGRDDYPAAKACVEELMSRCQDSSRWLANALVLRSRLERRLGDADAALADAQRAYNQAGNHLPVRIESLLARGKAQQERGNLTAARADFEKAYQLNNGANKRLEVISLILLAQVAVAQQQPQYALEKFAQAKVIVPSINHGFILNRFRRLEAQLDTFEVDFVIASGTETLDYATHESALRRWLLEKALREDNNLTRVAERLGVSKKTVYQWREAYNVKS